MISVCYCVISSEYCNHSVKEAAKKSYNIINSFKIKQPECEFNIVIKIKSQKIKVKSENSIEHYTVCYCIYNHKTANYEPIKICIHHNEQQQWESYQNILDVWLLSYAYNHKLEKLII